jgi:uncharacterized protein YfbU (UPF0304 family)
MCPSHEARPQRELYDERDMDLTKKDRLIIANQLKILEKLYPDEADYYSKHRTAVEHGYKLHYEWLVEHFYDEMSEDECREVLDILNMYRALRFSYDNLEDKSGIEEEDIRFKGFDGNNETSRHSYVRYFILELERFSELAPESPYSDFNTHYPVLEAYRKMLAVWSGFTNKYQLSKDQIQQLVKA